MDEGLDKLFVRLDDALSRDPKARLRECSLNLGVDRQAVTRAVRANTGVSFREYQKQKVLIEAMRLLAEEEDLTECEIASKLGYKTTGAFERFIEVETGSKASEFRSLGVKTDKGAVEADERVLRPRFTEKI